MSTDRIAKAGAVTLRHDDDDDKTRILIITGTGGGWVLPMGTVEKGETPEQAAVRETHEEAGVKIKIISKPVATWKSVDRKGRPYRAEFFIAQYTGDTDWPEQDRRDRKWVKPGKARDRLPEVFHKALQSACDEIKT